MYGLCSLMDFDSLYLMQWLHFCTLFIRSRWGYMTFAQKLELLINSSQLSINVVILAILKPLHDKALIYPQHLWLQCSFQVPFISSFTYFLLPELGHYYVRKLFILLGCCQDICCQPYVFTDLRVFTWSSDGKNLKFQSKCYFEFV